MSNLEKVLAQLLSKLDRLENKLSEIEIELHKLKAKSKEEESKPVFHSLAMFEKERVQATRERVEPLLDKAAQAAIDHFKLVPPKRK